MSKQTIQDGTKCIFSFKHLKSECLDLREEICDLSEKDFLALEGQTCTVKSLETYTELGDKNFEYYNIDFSGKTLEGMSGYHLTPQSDKCDEDIFKYLSTKTLAEIQQLSIEDIVSETNYIFEDVSDALKRTIDILHHVWND